MRNPTYLVLVSFLALAGCARTASANPGAAVAQEVEPSETPVETIIPPTFLETLKSGVALRDGMDPSQQAQLRVAVEDLIRNNYGASTFTSMDAKRLAHFAFTKIDENYHEDFVSWLFDEMARIERKRWLEQLGIKEKTPEAKAIKTLPQSPRVDRIFRAVAERMPETTVEQQKRKLKTLQWMRERWPNLSPKVQIEVDAVEQIMALRIEKEKPLLEQTVERISLLCRTAYKKMGDLLPNRPR